MRYKRVVIYLLTVVGLHSISYLISNMHFANYVKKRCVVCGK